MSAITLLNDRILTRVIQAIGRCTRSPTDFSAVLILGDELLDYLLAKDSRKYLHPELQAEIEFGIGQAEDSNVDEFLENFELFLEHGQPWREAEDNIIDLRSEMSQQTLPGTDELRSTVSHEVKYQYCLWNSDFSEALAQCRIILGKLSDPSLRGYRALWNYLAGSAAFIGHKANISQGYDSLSRQYFSEASKAESRIPWLNQLASFRDKEENLAHQNEATMLVVERMELGLSSLGVRHDRNFERQEKEILDGIMADEAVKFEAAQVKLGEFLGYLAGNKETNGAPDPWWQVDENFCFIFEDHSNAQETSSLDVTKARQVSTHPNWVFDNLNVNENATIIPVLVTPVKKADSDAMPHLKGVYYWELGDFREWAKNALRTIRDIRKTFSEVGDLIWRDQAMERYKLEKLCPNTLTEELKKSPAYEIFRG